MFLNTATLYILILAINSKGYKPFNQAIYSINFMHHGMARPQVAYGG
jgi:hypothetical protein